MKIKRRQFIKQGSALAGLLPVSAMANKSIILPKAEAISNTSKLKNKAMVISTWRHGIPANEAAWEIIKKGGKAIDAVEQGVRVVESDSESMSVGLGGRPDRDGNVTLDACIMNEKGDAGSVCFLQHIENPISVARKIMEDTPHVMLAGEGALQFALANGFEKKKLLTEKAKAAWQKWLKESKYTLPVNIENHDTIGALALDEHGDLSGACTTSGLAYKMHGRVGDSPIIGAGLFVDNEVGAATATGVGELVMKTLGSFLVVELMRQGASAQAACEEAVSRIVKKLNYKDMQVGYLAIDKKGNHGAYSIHNGFNYALTKKGKTELIDCIAFKS